MLTSVFEKTISVIGLGYIGLPTAAMFAGRGINVIGIDTNASVVETVNCGRIHIVEPGLEKAVRRAVESGHLRAALKPEPAEVFFIAVPTNLKGANHKPDLFYIEAASRAIAPVLKPGDIVILESTSPVGTTGRMAKWLSRVRPDLSFPQQKGEDSEIRIAHCPERVLPGRVMHELVSNDRIIGGMTPRCGLEAKMVYETFVEGECILSDVRTAEMCKLAENAFRDVNIAYANELSLICERHGIDVWELIRLANRHPRVNILQPGVGVGGHCIAIDPWFIVAGAPSAARLIRTAREVNDHKPDWVLEKVEAAAAHFSVVNGGAKPIIAALGLSFKPEIDDLRESPALYIAEKLYHAHGSRLVTVEPHIDKPPSALDGCSLTTLEHAREAADILVILVNHKAFQLLMQKPLRPGQQVIDAAGLFAHMDALHHQPALHTLPAAE